MNEPVLEFDQYGFLIPYGPIPATLDTVERVFVEEFPNSITRPMHLDRYREYNARLLALIPTRERPAELTQWIDGSFVSQKQNPGDIDLLTFLPTDLYDQYERVVRSWRTEFKTGAGGRVDAHLIRVYDEGHRYRNLYESDYIEWLHIWGYTVKQPRKNKGFIEIKIN